ncbi:hypothetical protein ACIRBX_33660 [Kitasatospora sp. NPDC096147]|uniref:hypothetical protein n=1 Tax=Kitasatospora sp. NPDC096147 TaxID=3364093 RepID=UPI003808D963
MRIGRRTATLTLALALAGGGLIGGATGASATDLGGDGNPYYDCPNARTIASAPIVRNGSTIGLVEMRWSSACSGNWTRTTSYIGARRIDSQITDDPVTRLAQSYEVTTQNFSFYLRVPASKRMCSVGTIFDNGLNTAYFCSN